MLHGKKILAVIPARGGSKRLPKKNIKEFCGKPLISWTVEAALASKYIDRVIVSSDNEDIISISKQYGADVPFKRPRNLSTDEASTSDVIFHAINNISECYDLVIILQPTSPLRKTTHIDSALEYYASKDAKGVLSVTICEHNPLWSNTLPDNKVMLDFICTSVKGKRSQDLPVYYRLNGAIYIYDILKYQENKGAFFSDDVFAFEMDNDSSIDIDSELDFKVGETIQAMWNKSS